MSRTIFPRQTEQAVADLSRRRRTLFLSTGITGIAAVILLFGSQGFVGVGGGEPAFDAPAAQIHDFFGARDPILYAVGSYVGVLGLVVFLWFVCGLHTLLRGAEGDPPWRSTVALVSGVLYVAVVMVGGWDLAAFRVDEGLDPQLARFAFDMGNLGFATSWMALAGFALATGWVLLSSRSMPRWVGWWAIVAGVALLAARAVWTSSVWLIGYSLLMLWIIVVSVLLVRRQKQA